VCDLELEISGLMRPVSAISLPDSAAGVITLSQNALPMLKYQDKPFDEFTRSVKNYIFIHFNISSYILGVVNLVLISFFLHS